jgi:hypothetical protein
MNWKSSKVVQSSWPQAEEKKVLLRLAVFILLLFTTHWLALRLHPFGMHKFFWNLGLGAATFALIIRPLMPLVRGNFPTVEQHQSSSHNV